MIKFTEADIRAGASHQSFSRGADYFGDNAVFGLVQRGNLLTAQVAGSRNEPYQVAVRLDESGAIADAECTCPYDQDDTCKHIVAVLLAALNGDELSVKPDLDELLAGLTEAQLRRVIRNVVGEQPGIAAAVEREVAWLKMTPAATAAASAAAPAIAVDLAAIRREMQKDFRRVVATGGGDYRGDYWDDEAGQFDPDEVLGPHLALVYRLLDAGDAATATAVITAVIEEWDDGISGLEEWIAEVNADIFAETARDLGVQLAEVLLSLELSEDERARWLDQVEDWTDSVISLDIVDTALEQWWDYPPLVAAMQGKITEQGAWEGDPPYFADALTLARLRILQRQGRIQEYIYLAQAEGQDSLFVNMLARSGQVVRAVAEAQTTPLTATEILSLARVLVEQNERAAALTVAAHGLDLTEGGNKQELARWTRALATEAGDAALALRAAQAAFNASYTLADYQAVAALAEDAWPAIRPALLENLRQSHAYTKVDIYLHEHMLVEAMAEIDSSLYSDPERVIAATRAEYPDWGIQQCKRRAESIMNAGKATAYDSAVAWLRIAHDIYRQHGRLNEWQGYLSGLLELHGRKYKLVPMLRGIR